MKVHVVYDKSGEIISLGVPLPQTYDFSRPQSGPRPLPEQHVAELDVPAEFMDLHIVELTKRIRVDTRVKPHGLIPK